MRAAGPGARGHRSHSGGSGSLGLGLRADGSGDLSGLVDGRPGSRRSNSRSRSLGLSLGADGGGLVVGHGDNGAAGGGRGSLSLGLRADGGGTVDDDGGSVGAGVTLGDTELGGPLVLAGALNDEQETVVSDVGGQRGAGGPGVGASVLDVLDDGLEGLDVGAGSTEEDQRDLALSSGGPLDLEGLALGDLLLERRRRDGVTQRRLGVIGLGVGRSEGSEGREDSSGGETHFECCL